MDVVRKKSRSRKWLRWTSVIIVIGGGVAGATYALQSLETALPEFDRASVVFAEVQRGTMVREVRGPGNLIPEDINLVTAETDGTIVSIFVEPGDPVYQGTVLLKLRDRQMERSIREARRDVAAAQREVDRFILQEESQRLDLEVERETARTNFEYAREYADFNKQLARRGLIAARQWQVSEERAERTRMLFEVQQEREDNSQKLAVIELEEKRATVEKAQDGLDKWLELEKALTVTAPVSGVLQQLGTTSDGLEVGQVVSQGAVVAKVTDVQKLKAVLQISQSQARDIIEGQPVLVETPAAEITGRVSRIDPAVQNERVAVDVELTEALPKGARPDLIVEGLIEVSRLDDVTYVRRPVFSQEHSTHEIFRVEADGQTAVRMNVEFGASSVYTIEVVNGLNVGDEIVVRKHPAGKRTTE